MPPYHSVFFTWTKLLLSVRSTNTGWYSFHFKEWSKKKPFIFGFGLISFGLMDAAALNQAGQLSPLCLVRIFEGESDKEWQEKHFSRGVNYWDLWCFLPTTALRPLLNFKCHISWNNLRLCRECECVCAFVLWGRVLCLWGWTDDTGKQSPFLCRQSPFPYSKWFFNKLRGDG